MPDINKSKVSAALDRAAGTYDAIAQFQHRVCERLATMLPDTPLKQSFDLAQTIQILDGGCGTGYGTSLLRRHWPEANITGCDLSPEMVRKTSERNIGINAVCGDLEHLPFASASIHLAWSSLALQWCQPALAYAELQRILTPGGQLVFSTLGPDTLHELNTAFTGIDTHSRVLPFSTASQLETALCKAGFGQITITTENWVTQHSSFNTLLASIRGIGANQTGGNRRRSMMGKTAWQTAKSRYETLRDTDGLLPATYQLILVKAKKCG